MTERLETIAHNPFDGTLAGPYTAHPHHDPFTNEMHAITYKGDQLGTVWHTVLDAEAHVIREESVAVSDGPSIHDRSEEHTSELQSLMRRSYAVFCLKTKTQTTNHYRATANTI